MTAFLMLLLFLLTLIVLHKYGVQIGIVAPSLPDGEIPDSYDLSESRKI